jgi:3-dehydroquinate dehydratase
LTSARRAGVDRIGVSTLQSITKALIDASPGKRLGVRVVFNPAVIRTLTARDAIASIGIPVIEVHLPMTCAEEFVESH